MVEQKSDGAGNASDADIVALKPGTRIGRHEVLAVLGQGGFGITYRASDSQLHRDVAIKEYLPTLLAYRSGGTTVMPRSTKVAEDFAWGRDRFVAEGRTLASLHHAPGIVRVFDFLEINGTAYIVMEMLRGDTLEGRIKSGPPLDAAAIERILHTLLDGLEQVHDAGFLHRDIKPANILLDPKGNPTLIDFGASRAAMTGRTVAMTAIFTPGYAATEQMTSAKQGPWTDIYGLAATLYHAITGEPPPNAFDRLLDDEYKPLARIAPPGFPPGLIAGIDAGLAVRASDRPQSIAGWRAMLSMAGTGSTDATQLATSRTIDPEATILSRAPMPTPTSSSPASLALSSTMQPAPPSPPQRSRAPLYAGVAAAVLLLAGGGGYLALSPSKPEPTAAPQSVALQDMKVEDLERALAERRAADAAAAEKRRLEEEAQRKAEADAAAKQAADAELVKAEAARKAAEEELARLKTEIETRRLEAQNEARRAEAEAAQRKAEAEMAALRQAEEDARRKATAEAETKRLADEALAKAQAERLRTEEEAQKKAAAEKKEKADATAKQIAEAEAQEKVKAEAAADAKAKADAEAAARKAAEAAEAGLRLGLPERQKVQVALSSLGFDTRGSDGALGPRSREMIAAWQKARNRPATGFLDSPQHEALSREASAALQKYDADQKKEAEQKKKAEDEKKAAEEAAKTKAAVATPTPAPAVPNAPASNPSAPGTPAGELRWTGNFKCDLWQGSGLPITLAPVNGKVSQTFPGRGGTLVTINLSGNQVSGTVSWRPQVGDKTISGSFSATIQGNSVTTTTMSRADFKGGIGPSESLCTLTLSRAGG